MEVFIKSVSYIPIAITLKLWSHTLFLKPPAYLNFFAQLAHVEFVVFKR